MTEYDYDVIIIGGSSSGAQAANVAAKQHINVAVIEEHPTTGLPEHCSGLFSFEGLELLDSMPPDDIVFNHEIYGSRIVAPNGKILTVRKSERHALVCDRAAYDRFLLDRAISNGTKVFQPYRAIGAKYVHEGVLVDILSREGEEIRLKSKMVISAEGVRAGITSQLGLSGPPKDKFVNAAQFYMYDLNEVDKELVEVFQTHKYAPDFFAWLIPMSENSAKIGLGTSKPAAAKELERLIRQHPVMKEHCEGAEIRRTTAGRIPTTGPVKKTYSDRLLITGDVAGQTKPTTGGGVILGGIAAQIAGNIAAQAVKENRLDSNFLKSYQKQWKSEMMLNLRRMKLVRNYMNKLRDTEVDEFFNSLEEKGILKDIEEIGHVDNQGALVKKFMLSFKLYPFYFKTFPRLFKSLLES